MSSSTIYDDNNGAIVVATSPMPQDPICAISRTVFVITFANCPLLWVSKLQTEIALSTLYSEYVELSHHIIALLPLKSLIKEVIENLGIDSEKLKFVSSSTIYKDNNVAIVVNYLLD